MVSAVVYTVSALVAFAANSVLCRMALSGIHIDPVSFTIVRLGGGALALLPLCRASGHCTPGRQAIGSWGSGIALFVYAAAFSLSYLYLSAATGALILFGSVQFTMIGYAFLSGESFTGRQWLGLCSAVLGLIYLVLPGVTAPDPIGALFMCAAGAAWGVYSIRGKRVATPFAMTAGNFARAFVLSLAPLVFSSGSVQVEPLGVLLAFLSGAVTSGIGYIIWYRALPSLSTTQASIVQLSVPIIAAFGGVVFMSEDIPVRLAAAALLVLGGIGVAVLTRRPQNA